VQRGFRSGDAGALRKRVEALLAEGPAGSFAAGGLDEPLP
jgi:hypothetical protein